MSVRSRYPEWSLFGSFIAIAATLTFIGLTHDSSEEILTIVTAPASKSCVTG